MFCKKCGNSVEPGEKLCGACGTPVETGEENSGQNGTLNAENEGINTVNADRTIKTPTI